VFKCGVQLTNTNVKDVVDSNAIVKTGRLPVSDQSFVLRNNGYSGSYVQLFQSRLIWLYRVLELLLKIKKVRDYRKLILTLD